MAIAKFCDLDWPDSCITFRQLKRISELENSGLYQPHLFVQSSSERGIRSLHCRNDLCLFQDLTFKTCDGSAKYVFVSSASLFAGRLHHDTVAGLRIVSGILVLCNMSGTHNAVPALVETYYQVQYEHSLLRMLFSSRYPWLLS